MFRKSERAKEGETQEEVTLELKYVKSQESGSTGKVFFREIIKIKTVSIKRRIYDVAYHLI